jgi:hypothetical protein
VVLEVENLESADRAESLLCFLLRNSPMYKKQPEFVEYGEYLGHGEEDKLTQVGGFVSGMAISELWWVMILKMFLSHSKNKEQGITAL